MKKINIKVSKAYEVIISHGIFYKYLPPRENFVMVTDKNLDRLYSLDCHYKYVIEPGEGSKNILEYQKLLSYIAECHMTKSDYIVTFGGGVVGDLGAFAAATYMRGMRLINIPTSLLAMVDSSIGGKCALNLENGKNLVGTIYQPDLVVCDTDMLKTLPREVYQDGFGEVLKYSFLCGSDILNDDYIYNCIKIKADYVEKDEFDEGVRHFLNFGHTIGHAIEKCSDYKITHGRAIAIGMALITRASYKLGFCDKCCLDDIILTLSKYSLPTDCDFSLDEIYKVALSDKKSKDGCISLVMPRKIGDFFIYKATKDELRDVIRVALHG